MANSAVSIELPLENLCILFSKHQFSNIWIKFQVGVLGVVLKKLLASGFDFFEIVINAAGNKNMNDNTECD